MIGNILGLENLLTPKLILEKTSLHNITVTVYQVGKVVSVSLYSTTMTDLPIKHGQINETLATGPIPLSRVTQQVELNYNRKLTIQVMEITGDIKIGYVYEDIEDLINTQIAVTFCYITK